MKLTDPSATIRLKVIDRNNLHAIKRLCVSQAQINFVASIDKSLAEASVNPGAWPRGIFADKTPVGFVMLFLPFLPDAIARPHVGRNQIVLWRFMIDQRYQRMGFGKRALGLAFETWRETPGITEVMTSYVPGTSGPEKFYLSLGFNPTGLMRAGGTEIEITKPFPT